jgi:hypothetical protein
MKSLRLTGLTDAEIRQTSDMLSKLEPGLLPFSIFVEVARLSVMPIIDVVPVRIGQGGGIEVLLIQREPGDLYWPNMWHNPGTVIRATDVDPNYREALMRIFQGELGISELLECHFVSAFLHATKRGTESTRVYWTELSEQPKMGTFFDIDELPEEMIESHVELIRMAALAYRQQRVT